MKKFILFLFVLIAFLTLFFYVLHPQFSTQMRSLDEIKKSGELHIALTRESLMRGLPRSLSFNQRELVAICAFAESIGVKPVVHYEDEFSEILRCVSMCLRDVAVGNISRTEDREKYLSFTNPFFESMLVLVANKNLRANNLNELKDGKVTVQYGTIYEDAARSLVTKHEKLNLKLSSNVESFENLINKVDLGEYAMTIVEKNIYKANAIYSKNLKIIHEFTDFPSDISWATARENYTLISALNSFIDSHKNLFTTPSYMDDFDVIQDRKILRMITRDNPSNYYLHADMTRGFEYDMFSDFAQSQKLFPGVEVPSSWEDLFSFLDDGRGDLIAASFSMPDVPDSRYLYSIPYAVVNECVVAQRGKLPKSTAELKNRTFHVRASSSYYRTLIPLQDKYGFKIELISDSSETYDVINYVEDGSYDLSLIDDRIFASLEENSLNAEIGFPLAEGKTYVWVMRRDNPQLCAKVNEFIADYVASDTFKVLTDYYFGVDTSPTPDLWNQHTTIISPFDSLFQEFARPLGFDWLYVVAQAYESSRFDSAMVSPEGFGLLCLPPAMVHNMKCKNPLDPRANVSTGLSYMNKIRSRISHEVDVNNRIAFALASYVGGYGHLVDARMWAKELGLNPNVWKDNVEKGYRKLMECKYATASRYGFCRSDVVINYVNSILERRNKLKKIYRSR